MRSKNLLSLHRWFGLFLTVPILVVALSGSLLAFRQSIASFTVEGYNLASQYLEGKPQRLPLDKLLKDIKQQLPEYEVATWEVFDDFQTADRIYLRKLGSPDWFKGNLDPYSGNILRAPEPLQDDFTDWLEEFHYTFSLHTAGVVITTMVAIAMLLLGFTGIYMHRYRWKRMWQWQHKTVDTNTNVKQQLAQKEVNRRALHKTTGLWSAPILLIIGATGLYFNVLVLLHELEEEEGHHDQPFVGRLYSDHIDFEALLTQTQQAIPDFKLTYIALAYEDELPISFYGDVSVANPLISQYASGASFDPKSGEELMHWDVRTLPKHLVVVDTFRRLHFGNFAGNYSATLWALIGLTPIIFIWTGITAWLSQRRKRR